MGDTPFLSFCPRELYSLHDACYLARESSSLSPLYVFVTGACSVVKDYSMVCRLQETLGFYCLCPPREVAKDTRASVILQSGQSVGAPRAKSRAGARG